MEVLRTAIDALCANCHVGRTKRLAKQGICRGCLLPKTNMLIYVHLISIGKDGWTCTEAAAGRVRSRRQRDSVQQAGQTLCQVDFSVFFNETQHHQTCNLPSCLSVGQSVCPSYFSKRMESYTYMLLWEHLLDDACPSPFLLYRNGALQIQLLFIKLLDI